MKKIIIIISVMSLGCFSFFYLTKKNQAMHLKMQLPKKMNEIAAIEEENGKLRYEIEELENPQRLMSLINSAEFSHLKHPFIKDILKVEEGMAFSQKEN